MKEIIQNRFSCRKFKNEKIPDKKIKEIIDLIRLTPSSFGLEPWKFVVVDNKNLNELSQICNNQKHVKNCSHAVVIIARNDLGIDSEFLKSQISRIYKTAEGFNKVIKYFASKFIVDEFKSEFKDQISAELMTYASYQCYMACANLVNIAYSFDIKSCIIGGFNKIKLTEFVNLGENFSPVVVVALGFSDETPTKKLRLSLDEVMIWK